MRSGFWGCGCGLPVTAGDLGASGEGDEDGAGREGSGSGAVEMWDI